MDGSFGLPLDWDWSSNPQPCSLPLRMAQYTLIISRANWIHLPANGEQFTIVLMIIQVFLYCFQIVFRSSSFSSVLYLFLF